MARLVRKRGTSGEVRTLREERARARIARRRRPSVTLAQAEAAKARLDPWYVEDDPLAPDAAFYADLESDVPPTIQDAGKRADGDSKRKRYCEPCDKWYMADAQLAAHRAKVHGRSPSAPSRSIVATPDVPVRLICPRCGRTDWRANGVGLAWHLDNYPACASSRKATEHVYIQA